MWPAARSREQQQRWRTCMYWICVLFVGMVALLVTVLVVLVGHAGDVADALAPSPAPPPITNDVSACTWCDDLRARVGAVSERTGGQKLSAGARASMRMNCRPLRQADFANGTYLAEDDYACYELQENIVFDPAPWADYRASAVEPYASIAAFRLDFFAAFAVSAVGVTLDLNGFEMRQSDAHCLAQRFFAVIELSDRPFIRGQGPADFSGSSTGVVGAARNFALLNGRIGRSSHHGVHGNNARGVLISDVDIAGYEVAAVSLNGANDVVMHAVRALGTSLRVPVLGTYSSARFIMPFVARALRAVPAAGTPGRTASMTAAVAALVRASATLHTRMAEVQDDVLARGRPTVDASRHPEAARLFGNPSGMIDGNAYGFVFHMHGVAVNGFECNGDDARHDLSGHIIIEDCEVRDTRTRVNEVVAVRDSASGTPARGPAGDTLRVATITDAATGAYRGTALSDTKIALAELLRELGPTVGGPIAGTSSVHPSIVAWARGATTSLADNIASGVLEVLRNGDTMLHVNKGAFGIRISGGRYVCIERTLVAGVENHGSNGEPRPLPGETAETAYYIGAADGGHPAQAPQLGYMGADAYGIAVDAAADVLVSSTTVRGVHSRFMWARGTAFFNDARRTRLHDVRIANVSAFTDPTDQADIYSPKRPQAVGVYTAGNSDTIIESGFLEIDDVRAGQVGLASKTMHADVGISSCASPETNWYGV